MTQVVTKVTLEGFRNYKQFETTLSPNLTVVVGANAVGKTNLIEAIQLTVAAESFRRPKWEDVIAVGTDGCRIEVQASDGATFTAVEMRISRTAGRSYELNAKKKKPQDIPGRIPCVVFSPDDLYMIKGPAEERRRAVDEAGDQLSSTYSTLRREYARVLKQRNAVLRTGESASVKDSLDTMLVEVGARLTAHRTRLAERIAALAAVYYHGMSGGESLSVTMTPSWTKYGVVGDGSDEQHAARWLREAILKAEAEEAARSVTVVGPHRDDLLFLIKGSEARKTASQGQQRTAALAWKLAELDVMEDVCGRRPLLLLDDVMSELDAARRAALTEIMTTKTQTLVTTANIDYFDPTAIQEATILRLEAS